MNLWRRLSIKSKMLAMVLLASLIAAVAIMAIAFYTGNEAMTEAVEQRLVALRKANAFEVEEYFRTLSGELEVLAMTPSTEEALVDLREGFKRINASDTIDCGRELSALYDDFVAELSEAMDIERDIDTYYPRTAAGCYLQTAYLARNPYPLGEREKLLAPEDGTRYAEAHRTHHPYLRTLLERLELYDVFLVDAGGNVVYSVYKEVDFGTSLQFGPYRGSNLARLFALVRDNADISRAQMVDFDFYRPSYGAPASFIGVPVVREGQFLGMLAAQVPVERINKIINYGTLASDTAVIDGRWAENGLGASGEIVLISSADDKLRSLPRSYLENRGAFLAAMADNMRADDYGELLAHGPILTVRAQGDHLRLAEAGKEGLMRKTGYTGAPIVTSFGPLVLPSGIDWMVTAQMDESEAFSAVTRFGRRMLIGLCAICIFAVLLALLFVRSFMRPIEELNRGAEAVKAGDTDARVAVMSDDEVGELAVTFNEMIASVDAQKHEIARQASANESLLTAKFPPAVAERFRNGDKHIVENFENVTVVFVDLRRTEQLSELEPQQGLHVLNQIVQGFNAAAERLGLEIVRPVGDGYLAVCDMNSPRIDNTRRALDMALEVRAHMRRINNTYGLGITSFTGIEHGQVSAGVIVESTNAYDVWGRAVDLAQRIAAIPDDDLIGVGPEVVALVGDRYVFDEGPTLHLSTGEFIQISYLQSASAKTQAEDEERAEVEAEAVNVVE